MTKEQIIDKLTLEHGLHRSSAIKAVNGFISIVKDSISAGEAVNLRGLGSFKVIEVAERFGRDLNKNEQIIIPAHKAVKFVAGKDLKEAVQRL